MKMKNYIKILSAVMSLVILCGLLSPAMVCATSDDAYLNGLQRFFDEGSHAQLVNCPDAVYMEYAEQLRTNPTGAISMTLLGIIYGGLDFEEKVEPNKDRYKEALLNIIRTYEQENAASLTQQNLLDDTKSIEDYLQDIANTGLSWLGAVDTNIKLKAGEGVLPEDVSMAVSVINQISKDTEDWAKSAGTLKTKLELYETHDIFLRTVEENTTGALQKAASELRVEQSKVVKAHLRAYADLAVNSAEDYAKLFIDGIWAEDWINLLESKLPFAIPKVTLYQAFQGAALGVEIGKLLGNLSMGAEDIMAYIVEIKAVHDISVVLENKLDAIMDTLQKDSAQVTKTVAQNYIAYGNYLINCRIRGQYCMTAIYLHPQMQIWLKDSDVEKAEALYNRLTNDLLGLQKKLDAICSVVSVTPVLSGIEADSIQYYHSAYYGDFAVIAKDGKYGMIGYNGEMLLPAEYDLITQARGEFRGLPYAVKGETFYEIDMTGGTPKVYQSGGLAGGDVSAIVYWYRNEPVVFFPGDGIEDTDFLEEGMDWIEIEQNSWQKNAVLPVQEMSGIKESDWGAMPSVKNKNYALLDTQTGKLVSDFIYSGFDSGNGFSEGLLAVKKGDKWGFIDEKGNEVTDFIYDAYEEDTAYEMEYRYSIFTAVNGYIAVLKDGKWGLIDTQGNTVVETAYDSISQVNPDGMFWVQENGTWSLCALDISALPDGYGQQTPPDGYSQKVVVTAARGESYGMLALYDWVDGNWIPVFSCDATVGKNGIGTDYGEGKGKSPQGVFKLGVALSADSLPNSNWPYRQVTSDTCVVDDTDSRDYNTIQKISSLSAGVSYDPIGRTLVKGNSNICIYIEHNGNGLTSDNVEKGKGSVITICGKKAKIAPTAGCVDISAADMTALLSLMDYDKNPHIEITTH